MIRYVSSVNLIHNGLQLLFWPQTVENSGSRPLSPRQTRDREISTQMGDHCGISGAVWFCHFCLADEGQLLLSVTRKHKTSNTHSSADVPLGTPLEFSQLHFAGKDRLRPRAGNPTVLLRGHGDFDRCT